VDGTMAPGGTNLDSKGSRQIVAKGDDGLDSRRSIVESGVPEERGCDVPFRVSKYCLSFGR
jgi:hypothetical protein